MKTIRDWNDLRQFGITILTGEACNVGKRLLCDVTARGHQALCQIFGLPLQLTVETTCNKCGEKGRHVVPARFKDKWNSGESSDPSVGSILLARDSLNFLAAMLLLHNGCKVAIVTKHGHIIGIEEGDRDFTEEIRVKDYPKPHEYVPYTLLENDGRAEAVYWENETWITTTHQFGRIEKFYGIEEIYGRMTSQPACGLSNVHAATGRTA